MKCIFCKTRHKNTDGEGNILESCMRCEGVNKMLQVFVKATNSYIPFGETRPRRKLTITGFTIEKI